MGRFICLHGRKTRDKGYIAINAIEAADVSPDNNANRVSGISGSEYYVEESPEEIMRLIEEAEGVLSPKDASALKAEIEKYKALAAKWEREFYATTNRWLALAELLERLEDNPTESTLKEVVREYREPELKEEAE